MHDLIETDASFRRWRTPLAIAQIAEHIEVRKQPRILENVTDATLLSRNAALGVRIFEDHIVDLDLCKVRREQSRDDVG